MLIQVIGCRSVGNIEGGIEQHVEDLYPSLPDDNQNVELLLRLPFQDSNIGKIWKGMKITWLWSPKSSGLEAFVHSLVATLYACIKRPDLLHIHGVGPAIFTPIAKVFRLNVVVTHHGFDYEREKWGAFARWLLRLGEKFGCKYADHVICVSQTIYDRIVPKYKARATVINNGVTLREPISPGRQLAEFNLQCRRYILQVSRLVPEKRQLDLIRAFESARHSDWKLVLTGSTQGNSQYVKEIVDLSTKYDWLVLTNSLTGHDLEEIYSNAAGFVLPSSHEGLPIVILEALSFGLPVIASDIAPNLELNLTSGSYFPLGDVDCLSERLRSQLQAPWDQDMAESRRDKMRIEFGWGAIADKTYQVFQSTLENKV